MFETAAALCRDGFIALIGREVLQGPEQVTAEATTLRPRAFDGATGEQFGKKIMRQLSRRIVFSPFPSQKCHHRRIVGFTQLAERRCGLRVASA
jgi:hypothetical protein